MRTDRIALRLRGNAEAMDLGLQLARANWLRMLPVISLGMIPIILLAALAAQWHAPLALLVIWLFKPSLDRPLLHLLSRDLLGMAGSTGWLWQQRAQWWPGLHLASLTVFRFHPARSFTLPIWQLEGQTGPARRQRTRALGYGSAGSGLGLSLMASLFELVVVISLFALFGWLLPASIWEGLGAPGWFDPAGIHDHFWLSLAAAYAVAVVLVEPFYLGGGFGLYLNQRCRLECWDLEPALHRLAERAKARPA